MFNLENSQENLISPVLALSYGEKQYLTLEWNFHGVRNGKIQTSNLFIFRNVQEEKIQKFVEKFYSLSALGDLIGLIKMSHNQQFKSIEWIQKSGFQFGKQIDKRNISQCDVCELFQRILPKFVNRRGINSINIFDPLINIQQGSDGNPTQIQKLKKIFFCWKQLHEIQGTVLLNFLTHHPYQHEVDLSTGTNVFNILMREDNNVCKFLKKYQNLMRFSKIIVRMKFLQKNNYLGRYKSKGWVNSDFNVIQKTMHNVPSMQCEERLFIFGDQLKNKINQIKCTIELQYTFLDNSTGLSSKTLEIKLTCMKNCSITFKSSCLDYRNIQIWKGQRVLIKLGQKDQFFEIKQYMNQ